MKKVSTFILMLCLILPCSLMFSACGKTDKYVSLDVWDGTVSVVSQAVNNIIEIETAEELAGVSREVNSGNTFEGVTIKLATDIDLLNREWTPIGYGTNTVLGKPFNGTFDGQDHTIYNLNVNKQKNGSVSVGLFGFVQGSIKNLKIENAKIAGNLYVGTIAGYVANYDGLYIGEIFNCHIKNSKISCIYFNDETMGRCAGSMVGMLNSSNLTNCSVVNAQIDADSVAGQLIGQINSCEENDYVSGNTIQKVTVWYNETGNGLSINSGEDINNKFIGKI